jgi:hypothetical protein
MTPIFADAIDVVDAVAYVVAIFPDAVRGALFYGLPGSLRFVWLSRVFTARIHVNFSALFDGNIFEGFENSVFVDCSNAH